MKPAIILFLVLIQTACLHAQAEEKKCYQEAKNFAHQICGGFERKASELTIKASSENPELEQLSDTLIDQHKTKNLRVTTYAKEETYNVLRKHLAGELKNTRACREKLALIILNSCRTQTCHQNCSERKRTSLTNRSKTNKKFQRCTNGKKNKCIAKCRTQSTGGQCEKDCAQVANSSGYAVCDQKYSQRHSLTEDNINNDFDSCNQRCKSQ